MPQILRTAAALALALCLSAVLAVAAASPADADGRGHHPRTVRAMSFNIHHGQGTDGVLSLERVAGVIREQGAQVIGLQEVDRHFSERSEFVDQARWLAKRLKMRVVFGANLDLDPAAPGEPRRQYGTAILSAYPITSWSNIHLPRYADHEQRGLLRATVRVRGVRLHVYNTHLQHNDAAERLDQVRAIKGLIGTPEDSVILMGDLNATPDAPEIQEVTDGLVDAWEAGGAGEGHTYPVEDPNARIDYVLTSDDVVTKAAAVVTTNASDHLPVVTDLVLPGHRHRR